jgi:ABC-2 type transport system permease protein
MNWWGQLQAFLWLRWRLRRNRQKRAAAGSVIIETVFAALSILSAAIAFFIFFAVGVFLLPRVSAPIVMLIWDGAVVVSLFVWLVDLVSELQRSEVLSLDKFLHLPVSLSSVFLMNYVSSLYSPNVTIFLPAMIGLTLGMVFSKGPIVLLLFPVVVAFFLMVTALSYQFRGWLASLMQNKRRRRTIVTLLTVAMVLLFQIPNLLNFTVFGRRQSPTTIKAMAEEQSKLDHRLAGREIDRDEYQRQSGLIRKKYGAPGRQAAGMQREDTERIARTANIFVPIGWLPYGVVTLLEGRIMPSALAFLGLTLIGTASLARSYKTTLRLYTGDFSSRKPRHPVAEAEKTAVPQKPAVFMEKQLPLVSEQASAVTVACFRSLTRAPETKMMLLTPLIFTVIFGSAFLRIHSEPPQVLRPIMAAAVMGIILLGMAQLASNQFGFDRNGFRVFVLAGASRRDILLGKNLALLPFALGLGMIGISALQFAYPMPIDHWLAATVQMISMYMVYCVLNNFLSMLAPAAVSSGSLRPAQPKGMAIVVHLLFFFLLMPIAMGLTLIPLGIEYLWPGLPIYLLLTLAEFVGIAYFYSNILGFQGTLLQKREQRILEIVAAKVD